MGSVWSFFSYILPLRRRSDSVGVNLSQKDKELVQKSWGIARKDYDAAGLGFFRAFFAAHPEYQQMFAGFPDVPADKLGENKAFQAHARNVMNAISLVVDSLDDPASLVPELKKLGRNHGRRNIQTIHFRNLVVVLVDFLESALGPENFNEETKISWNKALELVVSIVETGFPKQQSSATKS